VTKNKLRARAIPSELHIGEGSRDKGNPIIGLLNGVGVNPAPYLRRGPDRLYRDPPPQSPGRGFRPRPGAAASPPRRYPACASVVSGPGGPPPAMGPAAIMSAPLTGPRGPAPMAPGAVYPPPRGSALCPRGELCTTPLELTPLAPSLSTSPSRSPTCSSQPLDPSFGFRSSSRPLFDRAEVGS
jgi:hypothetical protein